MNRFLHFVFSLVVCSAAADLCLADEQFAKIRDEIRESLERDDIPSLAVAVAKNGKIIWEEGFGFANKEKKIAATPHTPYSIASISKPITATGLMVLVERGKVNLDQSANDFLGEAKLVAHQGDVQAATVRTLANHTAGLPLHYQFFYSDESYKKPAMAESIRRYGRLFAPPGSEFQYANFGYGLLDEIITLRSGKSYADFMREEVFLPLAMKHTAIGIPEGDESNAAERYAQDGSELPFYDFDHPGASAVYSSAHDLALFGLFHLKQSVDGQKNILPDTAIDEMHRPTADCGAGQHYGVGWFIQESEFGYRTVSHTGGMGGVRSRLLIVPQEQLVVVTLCNTSTNLPLRIAREILGEMLPDYKKAFRRQSEHKPNSEPGKPFGPPELVGFWGGQVETYAGRTPVQMWAYADGDIKIKLGSQLLALVNHSRLQDGLLTGEFAGDIKTADANRRPYHLHLRVKLRGDQMTGAITAISLPARKAGNALSQWIELTRVDPDPTVWSLFNGQSLEDWRIADSVDFERHGKVRVENGELLGPDDFRTLSR